MDKRPLISALIVPFVFVAGCATTALDEDARYARLPTGVTLLESDRDECEGIVQVAERTSLGRARGDDVVLRQGQNATFEIDVEDEDVQWSCIGDSGTEDREAIDCPANTSHVRITREAEGDNFVLECYGTASRR